MVNCLTSYNPTNTNRNIGINNRNFSKAELCKDALIIIFKMLSLHDLISASMVSRQWKGVCVDHFELKKLQSFFRVIKLDSEFLFGRVKPLKSIDLGLHYFCIKFDKEMNFFEIKRHSAKPFIIDEYKTPTMSDEFKNADIVIGETCRLHIAVRFTSNPKHNFFNNTYYLLYWIKTGLQINHCSPEFKADSTNYKIVEDVIDLFNEQTSQKISNEAKKRTTQVAFKLQKFGQIISFIRGQKDQRCAEVGIEIDGTLIRKKQAVCKIAGVYHKCNLEK